MINRPDTNAQRLKRHKRVRGKISGTPERPRLNVFRSNTNIYAQVIDDVTGKTLVSASSLEKGFEGKGSDCEAAKKVGLAVAERAKAAGIEINLVPFDGAATAVTNLMGGHVQMVPVSESEVASGVASGKLKILAVCSSDRSEFNPDVPTLQELGYDVDVTAWGGFGVAKGTPDDVKEVLYACLLYTSPSPRD